MTHSHNQLAAHARAYHGAGLCILPAQRAAKRPAVGAWKQYQKRRPTGAEVDNWFGNGHDALCIVCGAVSGNAEMLDFDGGGALYSAWREGIPAELLTRLVIERSPSGGYHVCYSSQEAVSGNLKLAQRQAGDRVLTLIETRGEGGLFLCAPTPGYELVQGDFCDLPRLTAAERDLLLRTAWQLNEYRPAGDAGPVAPSRVAPSAPARSERPGDDFNARGDIRDLLQTHGWTCVKGGENEYWRRPGKGAGNSATLKEGVFYVFSSNAAPFEPNQGYAPFAVYALLEHGGDFEAAARQLRRQGYGDTGPGQEVDISGLIAAGTPGAERDDEDDDGTEITNPGPFPMELLENLPTIVQAAMDYYASSAIEVQRVMFLASFLAASGAILGHKVKDVSGLRTNIYTVGTLGTGGGKEATRETVDRIFQRAGVPAMCGAEEFASDAGLIKAVSIQNPILFQIDEFGRLMHSIKLGAKQSPHLYNIASTLLKFYSKANGTFRSKAYADAKRNIRIDYPHVCVYGTTVIGNFWEALSYEAVKDGFLPRLLIFESDGENTPGGGIESDPPRELLEYFSYWAARRITSGNMERMFPQPMVVPYSPEAAAIMDDFRTEQKREVLAHDELGPLWSRARENAGKVAMVHACWKNAEQPVVETDSALWAVALTRYVVRQTVWRASLSLVDNPFHAECQKALQKLESKPDGQMDHSKLLQLMKMKSRDFQDLMATLQERGDVEACAKDTAGRPGLVYRLRRRRPTRGKEG